MPVHNAGAECPTPSKFFGPSVLIQWQLPGSFTRVRLPTRFRIKPLILEVLADGAGRTSEESQAIIRRRLKLNRVHLAVRAGNSRQGRFQNEHAFALADLSLYLKKAGKRHGKTIYKIGSRKPSVGSTGKTLVGEEDRVLWRDVDPLDVATAETAIGIDVGRGAVDKRSSGSASRGRGRRSSEVSDEIRDAIETLEVLAGDSHGGRSQAWRVSAAERREIERHAMSCATNYFESHGFDVDDVSTRESYDLACSRKGLVTRVEVKGTTTPGIGVFLTANEVEHAMKYKPLALFVLVNIKLSIRGGQPKCSGGEALIYEPWLLERNEEILRPLMYRYELPANPKRPR